METAPAIKTNEANLEELNKRIVEIKRKIVLKGESFIILCSFPYHGTKRQSLMTRLSSATFLLSFLIKHFCFCFSATNPQRDKKRPTSRNG